ncbi:F-box/WD repeat-containing protein 8 [Gouania willdenowi]|uniref:F-box domain-containing protein n=1 Tax=Gouania willdenowi TaxID=441366 RepID=A0A8C5N6I6_GOUWI|nr:F-box/WD repeat-containing protein 8 [Gouania willdenowi]
MAEKELVAFRESWKRELTSKNEEQRPICAPSSSKEVTDLSAKRKHHLNNASEGVCTKGEGCVTEDPAEDQPAYVSIAKGLLDGRSSPLLDRIEKERIRRKRKYNAMTHECSTALQREHHQRRTKEPEELVDLLIQDLNEVNDIPFFDIELPYELALKIFQYLDRTDLGRCAQVSRVWRVLAEDSVLWFQMCVREGYHHDACVSDFQCWKSVLRDCRNSAKAVRFNWKNRVGSISQLQYELGKVLCDVSSCDNFVLAGYTSGDLRLWDTLHWDSPASYLKPNSLTSSMETRPHVCHVQVNSSVAAAAYEDGCVDLWSIETGGEPIHHYQSSVPVQALALSSDSPALISASGAEVRLEHANDCGFWRTVCQTRLPNAVESLTMVPGRGPLGPLATLAAGDTVFLLDPRDEGPQTIHSVYGHPVTCLDASDTHVTFGVKRSGWTMHDGGNKIHVYSLESGKPTVCVGNAVGDFTCINLRDSPPHLLVCGNKDRRVRVFDLRTGSSVASLYAHHLGVTAVQADDWKIVSGGGEGLVCVWELRMGAKLWEMHNRHPVRHVRFTSIALVTANIPDDKSPRGACITDDDLTAHRRHRGVICHYDFSEDVSHQEGVLPICRSDYVESHGYNYNISLAVPYDRLSGSHPSL